MNRFGRPVAFTLEPDVVSLFAQISFGAAGAPTLKQGPYPAAFSKGFCNCTLNSIVTTATLASTMTSVTAAASLVGVYNGMSVTGTGVPASTTVSAVDPVAGTLTLSNAATASGVETLTFSGGQYLFQLGSLAAVNLDVYHKLLGVEFEFDAVANNAAETGTSPAAPACTVGFLVANSVSIRTIPTTAVSVLTDASLTMQFGNGAGASFVAANPASGELLRLWLALTRSTAI
jgi:hypothetical protein